MAPTTPESEALSTLPKGGFLLVIRRQTLSGPGGVPNVVDAFHPYFEFPPKFKKAQNLIFKK
jgi:hypothetical protein